MDAYFQALQQVVRPGCVVLDIGAGTGIFSLLACQFGAGHVHAVEPNDAIQVARESAAANGFGDRITFHQTISTAITLPQRADVIISDLRGVLPLLQHHIASVADARQRLLKPDGALIPQRDTLWAALIENAELYTAYEEPWLRNNYSLDMRAGQPLVVNTWRKVNAKPEHLLVASQQWAALDYRAITETNVSGELKWALECAGTAHGLLVWFDAELAEGVGFSNAPGEPELIYGQAFFPFEKPVELVPGEHVTVHLAANLTSGDYVWRWDTEVFSADNPPERRAHFRQSTFYGSPVSIDQLRKRADRFVPSLKEDGQMDLMILQMMSQKIALGDVARQVAEQYPERFKSWTDALPHVGVLSEKYSQ